MPMSPVFAVPPREEKAEMRVSRRDFARLSALGGSATLLGAYLPGATLIIGATAPAIAIVDEEAMLASAIFTMSL